MASPSRPNRFLFPVDNTSFLCEHFGCSPPSPPPPSSPKGFRASSLVPALPIAAASLFASAALAVLLALFILRRRRRRREVADAAAAAADHLAAFGNAGDVDHHVWYIRTAGLDESTIAGIATWAYKADEGVLGVSPADCAVCLSEFCDGEILRVLPKCGHAFHLSCIDTWLHSHVNCPLCRAPVVAPASTPGGTDPGASTSYPSALSSPGFGRDHMEPGSASPALFGSSQQNDVWQSETGRGPTEVEAAGERLELGSANPIMILRIPNFGELQLPADTGEQEFQPIRRSFSMGSFTPASLQRSDLDERLSDSMKETSIELDWINRTWRKQGNPSTGTTSHKDTE